MQFGLATHKRHRLGASAALPTWLRQAEPDIRALGMGLVAVGGTHNAIERDGLLANYGGLVRCADGHRGGLMRIVSRLAGGLDPSQALDGVMYLIDPTDPSSTYPETQALKRQCVIHGKPFVGTVAGAHEWLLVELVHAHRADAPRVSAYRDGLHQQVLALIAHDALKSQMVEFAATHFDLLSGFAARVATGTTGGLLNDMAWSRGWPAGQPWVTRYQSGPLGGDAQIAELVLDQRCQKVIFFEDPHVARQHEADIQLMERAVWSETHATTCFNSPAMAQRWAQAVVGCSVG